MRKIERFNNKPTQLVPVDNSGVVRELAALKAELQASRQRTPPPPQPIRETQQTSYPTDFIDRLNGMEERLQAVEAAVQQFSEVSTALFQAFELLKDMHENHTHDAEILRDTA